MNKCRHSYLCAIAVWSLAATSLAGQDQDAVKIGVRRELFIDRHLIEKMDRVNLKLMEPRDAGVALALNAPWEGRFSGYVTVLRDGDVFRMYYRGLPDIGQDEVTCMAESRDGKTWYKPVLWKHETDNHAATNIVLAGSTAATHNFCPFIDENPKADPTRRYKAIGGSAKSGLLAYVSPDGINWELARAEPVLHIGGWVFDSQNVVFWSSEQQRYLMYFRRVVDGVRAIARTTSEDFLNWSEPVQMTYSDTDSERPRFQLYTNQTQPYFRAPHIMLATAARYMPGRRVLTPEQVKSINVDARYAGDVSDSILLTTRGGSRYDVTFGSALLPPGIGAENWVSRTNYPALGLIETDSSEMSWFVNHNYGQPTAHIRRYTFRLDGISCATADIDGGEISTKPVVMNGDQLEVNFATSAAGSVRIEIQDSSGNPIEGFELEKCNALIGNEIRSLVSWGELSETTQLRNRPIRLRFELKDARIFSYRFLSDD